MKTIFTFVFLFFLYGVSFADVTTTLWDIKKSEHFIIYSRGADSSYVNEVAKKAEQYYRDIAEEIGFTRMEEFWTWDKRTKIYLFKDKQEYKRVTKQPDWSAGGADTYKHEIYSYLYMDNFFNVVLPHELAHVIFRDYVGFDKKLPLWLDEGIACYMEKGQRMERMMIAKVVIKNSEFMTVDVLSKVKRGGIFMPEIFYAESASLIDFLLKTYGKDKFLEFCRRLRDLKYRETWEKAFKAAYKIDNMDEFNKAWINYLAAMPFSRSDF